MCIYIYTCICFYQPKHVFLCALMMWVSAYSTTYASRQHRKSPGICVSYTYPS